MNSIVGTGLNRRAFLGRGASLAVGLSAAGFLSACGGDSGGGPAKQSKTGTINLMTYPNWVGPDEIANFEAAHPGVRVKEVTGGVSSTAQQVALIAQNSKAYDLGLFDRIAAGQLKEGGLLAAFDPADVPNLAGVEERYRTAFPWGIPTDYGCVGIAYRSDLVDSPPESWADLWSMAPSYDGRIAMVDYDQMIMGVGIIRAGHKIEDEDDKTLKDALDVLVDLKPYLGRVSATNTSKDLLGAKPRADISIDFDFSVAAAQIEDPRIKFVIPSEGAPGFIEGWCAVKTSEHLDLVWELMDAHLEPKAYASFIETTGASSVVPAASSFLSEKLKSAQAKTLSTADLNRVQYTGFIAPETGSLVSSIYSEFKSA